MFFHKASLGVDYTILIPHPPAGEDNLS
jgi:hypothetical protein